MNRKACCADASDQTQSPAVATASYEGSLLNTSGPLAADLNARDTAEDVVGCFRFAIHEPRSRRWSHTKLREQSLNHETVLKMHRDIGIASPSDDFPVRVASRHDHSNFGYLLCGSLPLREIVGQLRKRKDIGLAYDAHR